LRRALSRFGVAGVLGADLHQRGKDLELLHRAMGFSALGIVTMLPLLILVADATPSQHVGFAQWLVDGMGLSGRPAEDVQRLFSTQSRSLGTTSVASLVLVWLFGLSFAASVQTGYERVWDLPSGPWHKVWRQACWLVLMTVYLDAEAQGWHLLGTTSLLNATRFTVTVVSGVAFFWWGQRFLLGGRVPWRRLLPGAFATVAGLAGLRGFSVLVFSPLLISNAVTYGAVGVMLVVQSWLIGVGFVVYGGALVGEALVNHGRRERESRGGPQDPSAYPPA